MPNESVKSGDSPQKKRESMSGSHIALANREYSNDTWPDGRTMILKCFPVQYTVCSRERGSFQKRPKPKTEENRRAQYETRRLLGKTPVEALGEFELPCRNSVRDGFQKKNYSID